MPFPVRLHQPRCISACPNTLILNWKGCHNQDLRTVLPCAASMVWRTVCVRPRVFLFMERWYRSSRARNTAPTTSHPLRSVVLSTQTNANPSPPRHPPLIPRCLI